MKKALKLALLPAALLVNSAVFAATPGSYLGLGLGYSSVDKDSTVYKKQNGGLGGRVFLGYNFNSIFGVETSYATLYKTSYLSAEYPGAEMDLQLNTLSLVGKLYLPLSRTNPLNIYGLLGIAAVYNDMDLRYQGRHVYDESDNAIVATAGLGASYDLNERVTANLEYSRFGNKRMDYNYLGFPNSNLVTFGLAYKF